MEKKKFLNGNKTSLIVFLVSAVLAFIMIIAGIVVGVVDKASEGPQKSTLYGEQIYENTPISLSYGINTFVFDDTTAGGMVVLSITNPTNVSNVYVIDAYGNQLLNDSTHKQTYTFTTKSNAEIQIKIVTSSSGSKLTIYA